MKRSVEEGWQRTGKALVSVRWVDTDKGVDGQVDARSTLVASHFKGKEKEDSISASTPPLEGLRMLCRRAASVGKHSRSRKASFMDARKAHLHLRCEEEVYIALAQEAGGGESMCEKLQFWLYGMRPAASAWEELYAKRMEGAGFIRGKRNSLVFYNRSRDLSVLVHGYDFVAVGEVDDIEWFKQMAVG